MHSDSGLAPGLACPNSNSSKKTRLAGQASTKWSSLTHASALRYMPPFTVEFWAEGYEEEVDNKLTVKPSLWEVNEPGLRQPWEMWPQRNPEFLNRISQMMTGGSGQERACKVNNPGSWGLAPVILIQKDRLKQGRRQFGTEEI